MGRKMKFNIASTYDECIAGLSEANATLFYPVEDKVAWCNATWDSVFCWPLAPANTTALLQCPPVEGLVANEMITKFCDYSGRWADTNMRSCLDLGVLDNIPEETTTAVIEKRFTNAFVSGSADIVEYVGLSLSILDILITLFLILFTLRRQWRLNQVRVGLLTALLIMCILWLAVRIDKNLKDSTYSYKGIIFINRPVCEAFLGLLEWSKLFVASWLACVCFHGLLEVVKPAVARRCMNLIFYALFTFVYSSIVVAVWVVLVKFAEDVGCANKYESRPLFHVITWPCFVLISAATILAFIHTLRAMFKVCGHAERPNPNKRKMMQGIVHLIICLYAAVFWYFNYMAVFSDEVFSSTGRPSTLLTAVATYVVYFLGAFIAVWIGACQCCLPAKEV